MTRCLNLLVAIVIACLAGLAALGPEEPAVAGSGLPSRTPPRPESPRRDESQPPGAYIELVAPDHPGAWSTVQWQDAAGRWHEVEGWRGHLDRQGVKRWWVSSRDFGRGPFRWVVVNGPASGPFYLPTEAYQVVQVRLLSPP